MLMEPKGGLNPLRVELSRDARSLIPVDHANARVPSAERVFRIPLIHSIRRVQTHRKDMNSPLRYQYLRKIGPPGYERIVMRHDVIEALPYRVIVLQREDYGRFTEVQHVQSLLSPGEAVCVDIKVQIAARREEAATKPRKHCLDAQSVRARAVNPYRPH